jgi:hypothetical protein
MAYTRPVTPPSQTDALNPTINSTPISQGSGSNSAYDTKANAADYYPYLREDLQNCATIEFEEFLEHIFGFKFDPKIVAQAQKIVDNNNFKRLMDKYCGVVPDETGRYVPFVEMVNYTFDRIGLEEIRLCRNDLSLLWGSHAARKPDVLGVLTNAFQQGGRFKPDNFSEKGPSAADAFHWGEVLDFWEFKLTVKSYAQYIKSTASSKLTFTYVGLS